MVEGGLPDPGPYGAPKTRRLAVNFSDLDMAFEDATPGVRYYLNLETGELARVTDEIQRELEEVLEGIDREASDILGAVSEAVAEGELDDEVLEAAEIEADDGSRYLEVPEADSQEGYRDMEAFIEMVADERLQRELGRAIQGRGAFRRFKDVLLEHSWKQ